jgi:uncharacterized membrane protein YhaH (DUF805 family)
MNYYLEPWKKYAMFDGRARRREYWYFILGNAFIGAAIEVATLALENTIFARTLFAWVFVLFGISIIVPTIAVAVRRLHDSGRSGVWFLIYFAPAIGFIWFLILMLFDSTPGDNKYGPNPKVGSIANK